MATTPATATPLFAAAHVRELDLSTTYVAGPARIAPSPSFNPSVVERVIERQRAAEQLRREAYQRVQQKRRLVEQRYTSTQPKPTKGRLLYSVLPDGSIALHAFARDYDAR